MSKFICPHNGADMPCMVCDNEMLVKHNLELNEQLAQLRRAASFALAVLWGSDGDKRGAIKALERVLDKS